MKVLAALCLLCGLVTLRAQDAPPPVRQTIESIEFRGARRAPQDTLRGLIHSKLGDFYNEEAIRQDFIVLWNSKRFDDIQVKTEAGTHGGVVLVFVVTEIPANKP